MTVPATWTLRRLRARLHGWLTRPTPARYVAVGYLAYMGAGWALLALPWSQAQPVGPVDSLFIAVSAVSTTGLVTVDPGTAFKPLGQAVILALIQAGGLGFMTLSSFAWAVLSRPSASLRERVARTVFAVAATSDVRTFLRRVVVYTLTVEAIGAALLWPLLERAGVPDPLWSAVFHAVSAFCTAGFSLYATSLEGFAGNPALLAVISALSLLGAIGFLVASEVWDRLRGRVRALGVTSRVVLLATALLVVGGTALMLLVDPGLAARPWPDRLAAAAFQSMTAATTVGFNSVPVASLAPASIVVLYVLMLIGASPSGTGGGLKVTTVAVLVGLLRATASGRTEVTLLGQAMPPERIGQAASVLVGAAAILAAALFVLSLSEAEPFDRLLFEAISALGTVGLSLGTTGALSDAGKLVIITLMAIGRVGVLSFAVAVAAHSRAREAARADRADVAI